MPVQRHPVPAGKLPGVVAGRQPGGGGWDTAWDGWHGWHPGGRGRGRGRESSACCWSRAMQPAQRVNSAAAAAPIMGTHPHHITCHSCRACCTRRPPRCVPGRRSTPRIRGRWLLSLSAPRRLKSTPPAEGGCAHRWPAAGVPWSSNDRRCSPCSKPPPRLHGCQPIAPPPAEAVVAGGMDGSQGCAVTYMQRHSCCTCHPATPWSSSPARRWLCRSLMHA